jgi:hypothetical protein
MLHGQGRFFQKGGGTPNPFTVSLMAFCRGVISKICFFCKLLQGISKKNPWPPEAKKVISRQAILKKVKVLPVPLVIRKDKPIFF